MNAKDYQLFETYMLEQMKDSAHDAHHIYRVLYMALDIAAHEMEVDYDVLICACLLHDIGRQEQFENPALCHAVVGAEKAYEFLIIHEFEKSFADRVRACILSHRFRSKYTPESLEAKILFDSDKIDVTGALGIARTLFYNGEVSEPLYTLDEQGKVSDGAEDERVSFLQEYKYKLEGLYSKFYTKRAEAIAAKRQQTAKAFYDNLLQEVKTVYHEGRGLLADHLEAD